MKITRVETFTVIVPLHEGSWHSAFFNPEGYVYGGTWVRLLLAGLPDCAAAAAHRFWLDRPR